MNCKTILLFILLTGFIIPFPGSAGEIILQSSQIRLDYGKHNRGDTFADTLTLIRFEDQNKIFIKPVDAEVTCDCIIAEAHPEGNDLHPHGFLCFTFEVLSEEKDGIGEKIIYIYTNDEKFNLIRLAISIFVRPDSTFNKTDQQRQPVDSLEALEFLSTPSEAPPTQTSIDQRQTPGEIGEQFTPLHILYFGSPRCQSCRRVEDALLPKLEEKWGNQIIIDRFNIEDPNAYAQLISLRKRYGVEDKRSPFTLFIGSSSITGRKDLSSRLDRAIAEALDKDEQTIFPEQVEVTHNQARTFFQSLSFWAVVGAGLIDGVNPCAFATLVFFLSLLSYAKSTKRQMMIVGLGFTTSVFVVYLLLGLGAFRALQALSVFSVISKVIFALTFVLLIYLFILAIRDTIRYYASGRKTEDQTLQLSQRNKRRIHQIMRKGLKTRNLLLGSSGIGALVSLFEAVCTGQVYLPTIVLMLKDPSLSAHAFFFLLLYNVLFITPLLFVFALAYVGTASEQFADWSKRNFGVTRIALSVLFLLLAVLMALELIQGLT